MNEPKNNDITATDAFTKLKWMLAILGTVALGWFIYQVRIGLLLGIAAILLGVILGGLAIRLEKCFPWKKCFATYRIALGIVVLGVFAVFVTLAIFLIPSIGNDLSDFETDFVKAIEQLKEYPVLDQALKTEESGEGELPKSIAGKIPSTAISLATVLFTGLAWFLAVVVMAIFAAFNPVLYEKGFLSFFPQHSRRRVQQVLRECANSLWGWLMGQGLGMLIIGGLTTLGLHLVGMKLATSLGVIAGIFQFVPYLGPFLSVIPALIVALSMSPKMVLLVLLVYGLIQFLEGNFITPMVLKREAYLPPFLTLLVTLLFGLAFGPIGYVVGTPLLVVAMALKRSLYQEEILEPHNDSSTNGGQ